MKFAITCPGCSAQFRSKTERPIGKGVQCPKCGHQFYVTAENQAAVRPARNEDDEDRPARRSRRDDVEDLAPASRRRRDEFDDDRPAPKKRKGKLVLVLLALGFLGFVVVGGAVGAYFVFFAGSGTSAEDKLRPRRDLPMDLLAYRPSDRASITLYNLAVSREPDCDPASMGNVEANFPPGHGITPDQIELYCDMQAETANNQAPPAKALVLVNPIDVAAVAARCKMEPLPGRPGMFVKTGPSSAWVVFQPDPKKLVFVGSSFEKKWTPEAMAKIAERPTEGSDLPEKYKDGLAMASGYAHIFASYQSSGDQEYNVTGDYQLKSGIREQFAVRFFKSPEAAKKSYESEKTLWSTMSAKAGGDDAGKPDLWVRGDRNFYFNRQQMGKRPK